MDEDKLPSCIKCYEQSVRNLLDPDNTTPCDDSCLRCCGWNFYSKSPAGTNDKPDEDYPTRGGHTEHAPEGREPGLLSLPPVKLNAKWLKKAVRYAYLEFRDNNWSVKQLDTYIQTCNISTSIVHLIKEKVTAHKLQNIVDAESVVPPIWSLIDCFTRHKYPDIPMHALGHGIGPDEMLVIHQIFTHHNKLTSFCTFANETLRAVQALRLDYCKIKTLPKAAWVGENNMAFLRLAPYLYGSFLRNNILSQDEGTNYTVSSIKCMINAFSVMLSTLMTMRNIEKSTMNSRLMLFMSTAHYLHSKYGKLNRKSNTDTEKRRKRRKTSHDIDPFFELTVPQLKSQLDKIGARESGRKAELVSRLNDELSRLSLGRLTVELCLTGANLSE